LANDRVVSHNNYHMTLWLVVYGIYKSTNQSINPLVNQISYSRPIEQRIE